MLCINILKQRYLHVLVEPRLIKDRKHVTSLGKAIVVRQWSPTWPVQFGVTAKRVDGFNVFLLRENTWSTKHEGHPFSGGWLNQPIWKIWSSNWIISPNRVEHKHIWNHFAKCSTRTKWACSLSYLKPPPRKRRSSFLTEANISISIVTVIWRGILSKYITTSYDKLGFLEIDCASWAKGTKINPVFFSRLRWWGGH